MGNSSTRTRRLTIENDDPAAVISVSGDVVERLKGSTALQRTDEHQTVSGSAMPNQFDMGASGDFLNEPPMSTLQLRYANVLALKENDRYWEKRVLDLKVNHKKMHEVMEDEYRRAIEEVHGCEVIDSKSKTPMPCGDNRTKVLRCYRNHPKEPMRCAKEVEDFANCVDLKRAALVESKG